MTPGAATATGKGFVATGASWTFDGTLTFADAADVYKAARELVLPADGMVDLSGLGHADSSALAVMLALKRRAAAESARLRFTAIPQGIAALAHAYGIEEVLAV
jgi:phospholipid transport system transporter-binding protein